MSKSATETPPADIDLFGEKPAKPAARRRRKHSGAAQPDNAPSGKASGHAQLLADNWDDDDRLAALQAIHVQALRDGDHRTAIAAITEANRMQGSHAAGRAVCDNADAPPAVSLIERIIIEPGDAA